MSAERVEAILGIVREAYAAGFRDRMHDRAHDAESVVRLLVNDVREALLAAETDGEEGGTRCICTRFVALPWCPADHDEDACGAKHPTNTSVIPCMIYGRPHTEHWSWSGCAGGHVTWTALAAETGGLAERVATAVRTLDDLIRAVETGRYRYERVHVLADLGYLRALLAQPAPSEGSERVAGPSDNCPASGDEAPCYLIPEGGSAGWCPRHGWGHKNGTVDQQTSEGSER